MTTLYKLNEQYQELLDKLTYEEVENEEELLNELTQILISIEEKAENTAIIIKKLDAEAEMIRKIFNWYLDGAGFMAISKRLTKEFAWSKRKW